MLKMRPDMPMVRWVRMEQRQRVAAQSRMDPAGLPARIVRQEQLKGQTRHEDRRDPAERLVQEGRTLNTIGLVAPTSVLNATRKASPDSMWRGRVVA